MGINAKLGRDITRLFYLVTAYSVGMGCGRPNVLPQPEQSGRTVTQSTRTHQSCIALPHPFDRWRAASEH